MVWTESIWLRTGTSGGLLWTIYWTFGSHKMLGSSWVATQLAASQEEFGSISEWSDMDRKIILKWILNLYCENDLVSLTLGNSYMTFFIKISTEFELSSLYFLYSQVNSNSRTIVFQKAWSGSQTLDLWFGSGPVVLRMNLKDVKIEN
jgi:hypothetical protein